MALNLSSIYMPLRSIRQHMSYDDCLEDKREDCQKFCMLLKALSI